MACIAERNNPEAIVPLTRPSRALQVINQAEKMMGIGRKQWITGQPVNFTANITINVDGSKGNLSEAKMARMVRDEIEKIFRNLRTTYDPGVEY